MEKRTPHCPLALVKSFVIAGRIRVTSSALAGAASLDLGFSEIVAVVGALTVLDDVLVVSFKEL